MPDIEEQYLQWLYYIHLQAISIIIYKSFFFTSFKAKSNMHSLIYSIHLI